MNVRPFKPFVAVLIGSAALFTFFTLGDPVGGAALPTIRVSPHRVAAGRSVTVSGTCEPSTSGFAISSAFGRDASHEFAGVGAAPFATDAGGHFSVVATISASATPGTYTVSGRCGGGNIGVTSSVRVINPVAPPTRVVRGEATFTG